MKSILIVEDSLVVSIFVREQIKRNLPWMEIEIAPSLSAAREVIKRSHQDIIILDLHLPDSEPNETLKVVPEFKASGARVIVSTGLDGMEARCKEAGADDFLSKLIAVDAPTLVNKITHLEDAKP